MEHDNVEFILNGNPVRAQVNADERLVDVLRGYFGLTGTKKSCGSGECGSCTVLLDGRPVASCLLMIGQVMGRKVTTIEGIRESHIFKTLQETFIRLGAFQCGFCAPGVTLVASWLLEKNPKTTKSEVRDVLSGNLCRCTGYQKIIEATLAACDELSRQVSAEEKC
jgi:aerobic-type carbon monoxide dehydrogenase small subunit (CoxS/CutS family)